MSKILNPWGQITTDPAISATSENPEINSEKFLTKLIEMQSENQQKSQDFENQKTREKIEKIEKQLEQLIQLKSEKPKTRVSKISQIQKKSQKCYQCEKIMVEMRQMASEFEKTSNVQNDEVIQRKQAQFNAEKKLENLTLDFNQKENQLKTALDGVVRYKNLFLKEKSRADSTENSIARAAKEISNERKNSKKLNESGCNSWNYDDKNYW